MRNMSGRMDRDIDGRRGPSDYFRGGIAHGGGGDYYGGGPPPYLGGGGLGSGRDIRDFRDNRVIAPSAGRGRFNDNSRGPPPPLRNRRRPVPPGIITFRSYEEEREWVEDRRRRRLSRPSKFDLMPTTEHEATKPVLMQMNPDHSSNEKSWMNDFKFSTVTNSVSPSVGLSQPSDPSTLPQQTRHARRLYVGNLPQFITEDQIHRVFRDAIWQALVDPTGEKFPFNVEEDPILSVYINHERRFCFLEFKSVELCSACMALDGLEVMPGQPPVKVKRPNDYNPSLAPKAVSIPELDVSRLGIISPTVLDGPNKIFIGGLHYHMTEAQVLELLQAFGKVKAFHLVKNEPDATTSKGYAFVEYSDSRLTATVVASLNGMDIGGGKSLTARLAGERHGSVAPILTPNNTPLIPVPTIVQAQQLQQNAQTVGVGQTSLSADRNVVNGYDVENLVDAALGKCPMPAGPSYFDSFGQPLTRILHVNPPALAVPALTPQQQLAINALPSMNSIPAMNGMMGVSTMTGMGLLSALPPGGTIPQLSSSSLSTLPPLPSAIPMAPTATVPALTPQQQAAINALSFLPVGGMVTSPHVPQPTIGGTRILVLLNIVSDEDLANEENHAVLIEEIKEECTKFGTLKCIKIPREASLGVEASAIRKVFLEYDSVEDAMKAELELSGRQFGPNVVETSFFPEIDYAEDRLH